MPGMPKRREKRKIPKPGRPTKIEPEIHQKLIESISAGNYLETAASYVGITPATVRNWMRRGAKEQARRERCLDPKDDEAPFLVFYGDITAAMARAEERAVLQIVNAGKEHWQAALSFLERRFPQRWSARVNITVREELDVALEVLEQELTEAEYLKVLRALARNAGLDPPE